MLTEAQFNALPYCFQEIVEIDRQLAGRVVQFDTIQRLIPHRRIVKRLCEITVRQPKSGGLA